MRVSLVKLPFYSLFGLNISKMKTYPLNLLALATYSRDVGGHEMSIVDGENVQPHGWSPTQARDPELVISERIPEMLDIIADQEHAIWEKLLESIMSHDPDVVGITCNTVNMDSAAIMTRKLKGQKVKIVIGGPHPTSLPEQSLAYTGADAVVIGEGEAPFVKLLNRWSDNRDLAGVPSVAWRSESEFCLNDRAPLVIDLEELPIPDRSFIDKKQYFGEVIMTGRGCPFDCAYCASKTIWGRRVRLRSTASIISELEMLSGGGAGRSSSTVVKFIDDTFTVSKKRTLELLKQIIERGLNHFEFTCGVRADTLDEELTQKMAEANFKRVTLGIETGSPKILDLIGKNETNEDAVRALGLLRSSGIKTHAFFMIGFPGETLDDIELSKQLILTGRPDYVEVNMVTPYPGTALFPLLVKRDPMLITDWHRWFHQGMATHSAELGYDLDEAYRGFTEFAREYNEERRSDG